MEYKLSNYYVASDVLNPNSEISLQTRIIYSTITNFFYEIKEADYTLLLNQEFDALDLQLFNLLLQVKIIRPKNIDEFEEVRNDNESIDGILSMVLHTSANCQFGCSYCGQSHTKKNISDNVKAKLIEYVQTKLSSKKYTHFNVVWHGAEPLMSFSNLKDLATEFVEISNQYNVNYSSTIITNGLSLKNNIFLQLAKHCKVQTFQITLDGDKEFHDRRRHLKDGLGTFDNIIKNIEEITTSENEEILKNVKFVIRINIDRNNYQGVYNLIDRFAENLFRKSFVFSFRPVENYGEVKSKDAHGYSNKEFAEIEIDLMLYSAKLGFPFRNLLPERNYETCFALGKESTALDIYGNMFSCYAFPYTPHELAESNKIGNILFDQSTHNRNTQLHNFKNEVAEEKWPCKSCNLYPSCGGYCPLKWNEGELACPSYKFNIKERLALKYMNSKTQIETLID
ncbi:MAG TPA: radical SAM protein [Edaphocola sp.]|nr:radical SAM protein [Edaphocola sp.]